MASSSSPLRIGTRASPLALWQANWVAERLGGAAAGHALVHIRTTGDVETDRPIHTFGTRAVFSKEIDEAVLDGRVDIAVHSLKDLPTALAEGLRIIGVCSREDPRDALIGRSGLGLTKLPDRGVVATSSLRRRAQLLRARPDLIVEDIRGNIETRLARFDNSPRWSATILAVAGLIRLGFDGRITERLSTSVMLPAPGQGAIAVMARADDVRIGEVVRRAVHDESTALCVTAERAFLSRLEGGCQVPVGSLGVWREGRLRLTGRIASLDGRVVVEGTKELPAAAEETACELGFALADQLLGEGGAEILDAIRPPVA